MNGIEYSIIINCLNTLLIFYLPSIYILSPKRGNRYLNWAFLSFWYGLWVILSRFVLEFPSVIYMSVGNVAVMWILMKLLYLDSWKRRLSVILIMVYVIGIVSEMLAMLFMRTVIPTAFKMHFHAQMGDMVNQFQLMGNLCFEMVYTVLCAAYFCLGKKKEGKLFLAFLLLPLYQFVLVAGFFALFNYFTEQVAWTGLAIGVFCLALDFPMLHFLNSILQKQDVEEKIREQERLRRQEYAYFEAASRSAEELRMIRHDFSNHLQAMYKMSDGDGNRETDREMVRKMLEEMSTRIGRQEVDVEYGREEQGAVCRK